MSVNDAEKYPYISREIDLVRDFAKKNRKFLASVWRADNGEGIWGKGISRP